MLEVALAVWVLVAPLDLPGAWGWKIVGGPFESAEACEWARANRLDAALCARVGGER